MSYRSKTYVALDYDEDNRAYNVMKMWHANSDHQFEFHNAHDLNLIREWSLPDSKKAQLAERMYNSKNFILLVGSKTKYKHLYVTWEIEQALNQKLPIIVVNLNNEKSIDYDRCPAILRDELAMHIPFKEKVILYSMKNWTVGHYQHLRSGNTGPYYWPDSVYAQFEVPQIKTWF